jgi:hypothetical protein
MLDWYLKDEAAVQRMRALPVGSHLDAFAAVLCALGYARYSIRDRLWTLAALGRWLKRRGLSVIDLRPDIVAAFLRPRTQRARVHRGAAATLALFLEHLEQEAIIPPVPSSIAAHEKLCRSTDYSRMADPCSCKSANVDRPGSYGWLTG